MKRKRMLRILKKLQRKTFDFASENNLNESELGHGLSEHAQNFRRNYSSNYSTPKECISYALRYGVKTAYQTWFNFKDNLEVNMDRVMILGGGCCYELPILGFKHFKNGGKIQVRVLDINAEGWEIFKDFHEEIASDMGGEVEISYHSGDCSKENLDSIIESFNPTLIIASNMLNEVDDNVLNEISQLADHGCAILIQDMKYEGVFHILSNICAREGKSWPNYSYELVGFPKDDLIEDYESLLDDRFDGIDRGRNYKFFFVRDDE